MNDKAGAIDSDDSLASIRISRKRLLYHDKNQRELRRIRRSFSFRLGNHLVLALQKPWRLLFLPFSLPILLFKFIREKAEKSRYLPEESLDDIEDQSDCIVFFPSNGVGFGHFTRLFSIAKKIRESRPEIEIIFFTTMPTLHLLENEGFPAYHLPGRYRFEDMDAKTWNLMTEEMMSAMVHVHRPKMFVFDGAYPYRGMLNGIKGRENLQKIWVRRGNFKKRAKPIPTDSIKHFDMIVSPKDSVPLVADSNVEEVPNIHCSPIQLLERQELLPRETLRRRVGIPLDAIVAYVQLGAGRINEIGSDLQLTIEILSKYEEVYIVLGESMLGEKIQHIGERIRKIREYPNSRYFNSFDFAIMAGGYNSYHEAVNYSLPTIFYPNMDTGKDDQFARVKIAENAGCSKVITDVNTETVTQAIEFMLVPENRERMAGMAEQLHTANGATEVASLLIEKLDT